MNEIEKIQQFLANVHAWLRASYEVPFPQWDRPWPVVRVRDELLKAAVAAWREYERDQPLDELQRGVAGLSRETRVSYGLYGAQLTYKLAAIAASGEDDNSSGRELCLIAARV